MDEAKIEEEGAEHRALGDMELDGGREGGVAVMVANCWRWERWDCVAEAEVVRQEEEEKRVRRWWRL